MEDLMGIQKKSYLDLSLEQRKEAAAAVRQQLQVVLSNPVATAEQRKAALARIAHLNKWERGALPQTSSAKAQS